MKLIFPGCGNFFGKQMDANKEHKSFVVSTPGKVILFGEHSVVYKKAAVCTSIGRRLFLKTELVSGNEVSLKLPQIDAHLTFNIDTVKKVIGSKCPLLEEVTDFNSDLLLFHQPSLIDHNLFTESIKGNLESLGVKVNKLQTKVAGAFLGFMYLLRGMCGSLAFKLVPFSMHVNSELEIGAGTGSSAAFSVALAASILQLRKYMDSETNLKFDSPKVQDSVIIHSFPVESGFTVEEVRIINKWAFCVEKIMHGRPSGIDNTTCAFGSVVVTSQEDHCPGTLSFRFLKDVPKIIILLISTGVSRNTSDLVVKVRSLRDGNPAAVDAILSAMDVIALEASKVLVALSNADSTHTLEHFRKLSSLIELNHGLLRTLGVSHESLEKIVEVTKRFGMSSKLTGAGGGGYAITLVPPNVPKEKVEDLKRELGASFQVTEINIAEDGVRLEK